MKSKHLLTAGTISLCATAMLVLCLMPLTIRAAEYASPDIVGEEVTTSTNDVEYYGDVVISVVHGVMGIIGIIAIIALLWGGFTLATATGKQERSEVGKKLLLAGSIVLFVDIASWGILVWTIGNIVTQIIENS